MPVLTGFLWGLRLFFSLSKINEINFDADEAVRFALVFHVSNRC
jgi:hypothetical protein